jgi:hypothetical protein
MFRRKPKIVELTRSCYGCPAAWEGFLKDGRYVYVRYRHGHGAIVAAASEEEIFTGDNQLLYRWYTGDGNGLMSDFELRDLLKKAKISFSRKLFPKVCDREHTDLMGCDVCGAPATDEAIEQWRLAWKSYFKGGVDL